jgi:uncharacterized repeat protein (TIGR02543 family)
MAIIAVIFITNLWQPASDAHNHTLTTDISPSGAGTIYPSVGEYQSGVQVTLTASAARGYRFAGWTGDVSAIADVGNATTTITINDDYAVTANFAPEIIEIRDWHDLDSVRDNLGASYRLMNDIDSATAGYEELAGGVANGGRGWQPIGASDNGFAGSFDGQGYVIRDLFINRPDQDYVGLFARISWVHPIENVGVVENIGLVDSNVTGSSRVGALVGHNAGIVNNSYSASSVTGEYWFIGGLVGYNAGGSVADCYSTGNVTGHNYYVGGLVGHATGARTVREGTVRNCYSTSVVTGVTRVGGLMGSTLADVSVSNSYFAGSVTGWRWVGGLVAENYGGNVTGSFCAGNVTGYDKVGGLVGLNLRGAISDCHQTGSVTGDQNVGGLVGRNEWGTIRDSCSVGSVHGNSRVGGLVGYDEQGSVISSFWDIATSGIAVSAGGSGKTTAEAQDVATFSKAGWNITAVAVAGMRNTTCTWNIVDGQTYPFLSWQPIS